MNIPRIFSAFILLTVPVVSQQLAPSQELTFERVAKSGKEYLRDSAEFPLRMTIDFSAIDSSGRVVKHRNGKFDYDFHGYNSRSGESNTRLRGPKSERKEALSTALLVTLPSLLLFSNMEEKFRLQPVDSPAPDTLMANFVPVKECDFSPWSTELYLTERICGSARVQLYKDDSSMKTFAFDFGGLPVQGKVDYLGQATINRFHVDTEFQKLMLPGDSKPFLVPRHIVLTVETNKGKLIMTSEFELKK